MGFTPGSDAEQMTKRIRHVFEFAGKAASGQISVNRSIMHYRTCWASSCESECKDGDGTSPCAVIDPVGTNFDRVIGQWTENGISAADGEKLRLVYGSVE